MATAAKEYRVRKGYIWLGPDGSPTAQTVITDKDPGFQKQIHKLEEVQSGEDPHAELPEPAKGRRAAKSPRNRMGASPQTR